MGSGLALVLVGSLVVGQLVAGGRAGGGGPGAPVRALETSAPRRSPLALYWVCSLVQRRLRPRCSIRSCSRSLAGGTLFALLPPAWLDAYVRGACPWCGCSARPPRRSPCPSSVGGLPPDAPLDRRARHGRRMREHGGGGVGPRHAPRAAVPALASRVAQVGDAARRAGVREVLHTQPGLTTVCVFTGGLIGCAIGPALLSWVGSAHRSPAAWRSGRCRTPSARRARSRRTRSPAPRVWWHSPSRPCSSPPGRSPLDARRLSAQCVGPPFSARTPRRLARRRR